jgi:cytochrome c oxidase subunit 1
MPRRIPDYPDAYAGWNYVSSIGAYISVAAAFLFVGIAIYTLVWGKRVASNYWGEGATSLEWSLTSPPPYHQFETLPRIR